MKSPWPNENYHWTWSDEIRYALRMPVFRPGVVPVWDITADGEVICRGHLVPPTWREWFRFKLPRLEWDFAGRVLVTQSLGCGRYLLRQRGDRRLAAWRHRRFPVKGVWRTTLRPQAAAVVFAIILENVCDWDPY